MPLCSRSEAPHPLEKWGVRVLRGVIFARAVACVDVVSVPFHTPGRSTAMRGLRAGRKRKFLCIDTVLVDTRASEMST